MAEALHLTKVTRKQLPNGLAAGEAGAAALCIEPNATQREIWRVLEAMDGALPAHEETAIEVVRRAGKTDGLLALSVGRCQTRAGYVVVYCAQTGLKSRERFNQVVRRLGKSGATGWEAHAGKGEERIEFDNGSVLHFWPPKPDRFRGDEIHLIIFDEAQEVDDEDGAELVGAAQPTFDTVEDAQLVVSGTAGKVRSGLLWESLEKGRAGEWAIVEYAAPDDIALEDALDDEDLWVQVHPGPATNPTPERVVALLRKRRKSMSAVAFGREYLGIWPETVGLTTAFSAEAWEACGAEHVERPQRFGFAFDVTPSRDFAAISAAWREADGTIRVEQIDMRPGVAWLIPELLKLHRQTRAPIGYDAATGSGALDIADELKRTRTKPETRGMTTADYVSACLAFAQAVVDGKLEHPRQPELTTAAEVAVKRKIGDIGWGWKRSESAGNIAPLVAATVALRIYDDLPPAGPTRIVSSTRRKRERVA